MSSDERWDAALKAVSQRAADDSRRTDFAGLAATKVGYPLQDAAVAFSESELRTALYPKLIDLYRYVGNGGFGPGYGFIALPEAKRDIDDQNIVALRRVLLGSAPPPFVIPVSEWGDGIWTCLDCTDGRVLTLSEAGLADPGWRFEDWVEAWSRGQDLWSEVVELKQHQVKDPFSGTTKVMTLVSGPRGIPYRPQS